MKIYKLIGTTMFVLLLTGIGANIALADLEKLKEEENSKTDINISAGYRGVSEDKNPSRALEYDSLKSSPLFNVDLATDQGSYFLNFNFDYLNENDYSGELDLNSKGLAQVNLRSERFFHNLDHVPYDNGYTGGEPTAAVPDPGPPLVRVPTGTPVEGSRPDGAFTNSLGNEVIRTFYTDQNPNDDYGLRLDTNEFEVKLKHPTYPAHINLAYWRYEKKGDKQMRFVGENCATACHMQSKTRKIDRVTEEFKAEADAHAGMIDFALEALFRTFRDNESIPTDYFGSHSRGRDEDLFEHSEDPDSKLTEVTLKANTAPSGGLVGSASFTIGERENQSDLTSVAPVKAETDYYKACADVTYTPGKNWTFNARYRLIDLDSDNTDQFNVDEYGNTNGNPLDVRDPVDITRSWYEAIVNYRPSRQLTITGELRREEIDRSNTGHGGSHSSSDDPAVAITINPSWDLPTEEVITRAKIGFKSRLLDKSALKLSGWVSIQHDDDPAYGTSFQDSQQLFLSSSYNPSPFWGLLANVNLLKQENDEYELHGYSIDREKKQQNINLSTYVTPLNGLSFDLNYGYFHTDIDQDILIGTGTATVYKPSPIVGQSFNYAFADDSNDYSQTVNALTLGVTWQAREDLSCRLEGNYTRSKASFSPDFDEAGPYPYNIYGDGDLYYGELPNSSSLKKISELDIRQIGLRSRLNWQIDNNWSCAVEATYDDYDDKNSNYSDGSVQTAMVSFSRGW